MPVGAMKNASKQKLEPGFDSIKAGIAPECVVAASTPPIRFGAKHVLGLDP
jgi:hypothetical protein